MSPRRCGGCWRTSEVPTGWGGADVLPVTCTGACHGIGCRLHQQMRVWNMLDESRVPGGAVCILLVPRAGTRRVILHILDPRLVSHMTSYMT